MHVQATLYGFLFERDLSPTRLESPPPYWKAAASVRAYTAVRVNHELQRNWMRRAALAILGKPSHRDTVGRDLRLPEPDLFDILFWRDRLTTCRQNSQLTILVHGHPDIGIGGGDWQYRQQRNENNGPDTHKVVPNDRILPAPFIMFRILRS